MAALLVISGPSGAGRATSRTAHRHGQVVMLYAAVGRQPSQPREGVAVDEVEFDGRAYESATGVPVSEYERRFTAAVRYRLMEERHEFDFDGDDNPRQVAYNALAPEGGAVEDVRLEHDDGGAFVVVRFRLDALPGKPLGWRIPVWPASEESPEEAAELFAVYLAEEINSFMPTTGNAVADRDGVYWMPDHR